MASSSSSSTQNRYQYDVFLSFRGEDTRKNFVDHLYDALQRQGIHTFKDDQRLQKGKRINDELLKSIEESKFCIIVFSKNYASLSWCLDELVKIMECQKATEQIAYPVFYDVDPSQVRKQLGPVGEAFSRHSNKEEVGKWREALEEAANLAGWDLRNTADGHEAKVINNIVENISLELRFINVKVDERLVGMESRIKDILSSFEMGVEDVRMIGIKGIGGGGKTTLARVVFEKRCFSFEGKSFVENVREVSKPSMLGLRSLQEQVLSNLLNERSFTVGSVHEGKEIMKKRLYNKKVILVLDDVDHLDQLEALAGGLNWFKLESRIIITTRDEQVLVAHQVKSVHDVNLLSQEEAMCLFSRYAFGSDIPIQMYEELSLKVVHYADGLPLTIKVLGSFLCGKDELEWEDAIERLETIPLKETLEKLELSYTGLEDDYKEIFLDVVCLMKGWVKEDAVRALESCGCHARTGLRVLEQKSLITISSHHQQLGMHDHIEEMGLNIVRRSHPDDRNMHSRLWIRREIEDVEVDNDLVAVKSFRGMAKLRSLHLDFDYTTNQVNVGVVKPLNEVLPSSSLLSSVSLKDNPHSCIPKTVEASNPIVLEMADRIIGPQLQGEGEIEVFKKLRSLELSYSQYLTTLDCGFFPDLKELNLARCYDLAELHVPIGCLRNLVYLDLSHCSRIKSLLFIKQLESLEVLDLSYLYLSEFPDILPGHSNYSLVKLNFSTNNVKQVPSSIGNLKKLVSLDLSWCKNLKSLPQSMCSLPCLKDLDLEGCAIEELSEDLGQLESLETLNLSGTRVTHLPNTICMLKHLKSLLLARCKVLKKLPEDIGQLESLEELSLAFCKIRDVPSSICKLTHLRELNLFYCDKLKKLPEKLGDLKCLQELDVEGTYISHLPQSISLSEDLKIVGFKSYNQRNFLYNTMSKSLRSIQHDKRCSPLRNIQHDKRNFLSRIPIMASSSSSSTQNSSLQHDVSLSFRSQDTLKKFVDHLDDALQRRNSHFQG